MKKMFKKIVASVMAVSTLSVGTIGMNVNAYGGSRTFYVSGVAVKISIDGTRTSAAASTICEELSCNNVYVDATAYYTSGGSKNDTFKKTRGTASVGFAPDSGRKFDEVSSYHSAKIGTQSNSDTMRVYV